MSNNEEIAVSICCTTYNHGSYIRKCLEGFLSQKTNFKYEVFINEDASTDNTAEIIREFEAKYPDIIKPIYQTENQFSKKIGIIPNIILPKMRGKYFAFCEGDDCWTDPQKLQLQYDALEAHPECSICTHYCRRVEIPSGKTSRFYPHKKYNFQTGIIDKNDQMIIAIFDLFHLTTIMTRIEYIRDMYTNPPEFKKLCPVGDVAFALYFVKNGPMYFINREMSLYNCGVEGSWTKRIRRNPENFKEHLSRLEKTFKSCKEYFNGEFDDLFDIQIISNQESENMNLKLRPYARTLWKYKMKKWAVKIVIGSQFPKIVKFIDKIKKRS